MGKLKWEWVSLTKFGSLFSSRLQHVTSFFSPLFHRRSRKERSAQANIIKHMLLLLTFHFRQRKINLHNCKRGSHIPVRCFSKQPADREQDMYELWASTRINSNQTLSAFHQTERKKSIEKNTHNSCSICEKGERSVSTQPWNVSPHSSKCSSLSLFCGFLWLWLYLFMCMFLKLVVVFINLLFWKQYFHLMLYYVAFPASVAVSLQCKVGSWHSCACCWTSYTEKREWPSLGFM